MEEITFNKCHFDDCLFIGAVFKNVEFHSCKFINCNFYKAEVERCYFDPRSIALDETYKKTASNIGVSLFQKLLENAAASRQAQHEMLSDIRFRQWKRAQLTHDLKDGKITKGQAWAKWVGSIIYEYSCGFGYSPLRLIITTLIAFLAVSVANIGLMANGLLVDGKSVGHLDLADSVFYTFSLLTSLGFSTVIPSLPLTKIAAVMEALLGIGWLSLFTSVLVRRFLK